MEDQLALRLWKVEELEQKALQSWERKLETSAAGPAPTPFTTLGEGDGHKQSKEEP